MRLFIGVPIDEKVRRAARAIIAELAEARTDFKWVEPENLHLTLAFLGETNEGKIPAVEKAMSQAVLGRAAFETAFGPAGAFESLEHPRVIWWGIDQGAAELKAIAEKLAAALSAERLLPEKERDRPFKAHLTLGRMRGSRNLSLLKAKMKVLRVEKAACQVDRIVLYQSHLSPLGPAYTVLAERLLG